MLSTSIRLALIV